MTLAAYAVVGTGRPNDWRQVREALEYAGFGVQASPSPRPTLPAHEVRPPRHEVLDLWARCRPLHEDAGASEWARSRGLDPVAVADRDLARALPADASTPRWAWLGARWPRTGFRVVFPLFDSSGELTSLHARNVSGVASPKGAMPAGHAVAGLVLADAAGRAMLKCGRLGGPLWITEGAPDYLTAATAWGDAADPSPALLSILSGSWTPALAARVPDGAHVVVAVHHDAAGAAYVERIVTTLGARVTFARWTPVEGRAAS